MKIRTLALALATLIASVLPTFAQNRVILTDDQLAPGAKPPAMCIHEGEVFLHIASQYPSAHRWTFYIVCTEKSWSSFMQRSGQAERTFLSAGIPYFNAPKVRVYATTYAQNHVTYIRGYKLIYPDPNVTPSRIVVNELARIITNSTDEAQVNQQAMQWIAQHQRTGEPVRIGSPTVAQVPASGQTAARGK